MRLMTTHMQIAGPFPSEKSDWHESFVLCGSNSSHVIKYLIFSSI